MAKERTRSGRVRREKKLVVNGVVHIQATFNNTIVTITDMNGNVIAQSSPGQVGFKGSRKSTPFAAQLAAQNALKKAMALGLKTAEVRVKGPGVGREAAIRALQVDGFSVTVIRDMTPMPHNGCKPPKRRRV
jgi:small subunit ribosomal protein S11